MANWTAGQEPLTVEIPQLGAFLLRGSSRPFEFRLAHPEIGDIRIWNPDHWNTAISSQTGQIMLDVRSKFLQLLGISAAEQLVRDVTAVLLASDSERVYLDAQPRPDFCRVARADPAVDLAVDRGLHYADLDAFVCQSRFSEQVHTLSRDSIMKLLRPLEAEISDTPPMDNKGVSTYKMPDPGVLERAAVAVLDDYAAAVRQELEHGRGWGSARLTRSVSRSRKLETVYFGMMKSPVYCRAYNKRATLRLHRKLYMLDVWAANGWDGASQVWRWEFSISSEMLKSMYIGGDDTAQRVDVRELSAFLAYLPVIWTYLTTKWIRQVLESDDKNMWRWDPSEYWKVVQSAWSSPVELRRDHSRVIRVRDELDRQRRIHELEAQARGCLTSAAALRASTVETAALADRQLRIEQLEAQARGCLVSAAALRAPETGVELPAGEVVNTETGEIVTYSALILSEVQGWIEQDLDIDVHMRRREVGTDDLSDCALTALHRAERMAEGLGS